MGKILKLLIFCATLIACSSSDQVPTNHIEASLTGIDARRCSCCGGAMITMSKNTEKYAEPYYQWYDYSNNLDLTFDSSFPISVFVEFEELSSQCSSSLGIIEVKSIIMR